MTSEMELESLRQEFQHKLAAPNFESYRLALHNAPHIPVSHKVFDQAAVQFASDDLPGATKAALDQVLRQFCPWKKGPFDFFGTKIDAEWRSEIKWDRLLPHLPSLKDKTIADIGCHNGYFMYRMLAHDPARVVGFEPVAKHWYAFQLIQKYAQAEQLSFEGLGVEHMHRFPETFDVVFCLGILYHHTDPVGLLRKIHTSMTTGAELIVDCQGIPGTDPVALVPEGRYGGATGIWFLPTETTLLHWLKRAGFRDGEVFFNGKLTPEEQRPTDWARIKSLPDFLNPDDPSQTIEGYPAPVRIYAKAKR